MPTLEELSFLNCKYDMDYLIEKMKNMQNLKKIVLDISDLNNDH